MTTEPGTIPTARTDDAYADVPYWSMPDRMADPNRLAAVALLHGLTPPDPRTARVLELGSGDGANCMATAAAWPGTHCVGIDLSRPAIERGQELAKRAGLDNVELMVGDLLEVDAGSLGEFDVVLLHGLLSWVPGVVREAAMKIAATVLAPGGLVMCDYDALPGWNLWRVQRAVLEFGAQLAGADAPPMDRIASARDTLAFAAECNGTGTLYAQVLEASAERAAGTTSHLLYHDDMNAALTPLYLHEVAGLAKDNGLAYVGEALASQWWESHVAWAEQLRERYGNDPVQGARMADLVSGPQFKASVFTRAEDAWLRRPTDASQAVSLMVNHDGNADDLAAVLADQDAAPYVRELVTAAAEARGRGVRIEEVASKLAIDPAALGQVAVDLARVGVLSIRMLQPEVAVSVGDRPAVHALVRAQTDVTQVFTSLTHDSVVIEDPLAINALRLLDGTRDRDALTRDVAAATPGADGASDRLRAQLDHVLDSAAADGLLVPARPR